jgi:hypothetical protein
LLEDFHRLEKQSVLLAACNKSSDAKDKTETVALLSAAKSRALTSEE